MITFFTRHKLLVTAALIFLTGIILPAAPVMASHNNGVHGPVMSGHLKQRISEAKNKQRPGRPETITIILETDTPGQIESIVRAQGGKLRYTYKNLVEVEISADSAEQLLGKLPANSLARTPFPHVNNIVVGEGATKTGATEMQALGTTGTGILVGVLDTGFDLVTSSQASGDLPDPLTLVDYTGNGTGSTTHGTNVAEIIFDMAPGVDFYLASIGSIPQMADAVNDMILAGVDVIVMSTVWFGPAYYDGTGPICDITDTAEAAGIQWVNSMGNSRNKHYDSTFTDLNGDQRHEFSTTQEFNTISLNGGQVETLILNWDDFTSVDVDYDLFVYDGDPDSGGVLIASSTNAQSANGIFKFNSPFEILSFSAPSTGTFYITVEKANSSQADVPFTLFSLRSNLGIKKRARSLAQPADCLTVVGVGATNVADDVPEGFSSEGPTTDGRNKPEVSAPDRVATSLTGNFSGTSASSPHVGGAIALLQDAFPGFDTLSIRNLLMSSAYDVNTAGFDFRTGYGRISLDADNDGLNRDDEIAYSTDPLLQDTDGDGLKDGDEIAYSTDPLIQDTDGDGLKDGDEVNLYGTDPLLVDTDADGAQDNLEVSKGTDPLSNLSFPTEPDGDINGDGSVNLVDLLLGYEILTGVISPTSYQLLHGDVAPLVNGIPVPDTNFNSGDVLVLHQKITGLVSF